MNVNERAQFAKGKNLCFRCLASSEHLAIACLTKESCGVDICTEKHHLAIHGADRMFVGLSSGKSDSGHSAKQVLLQIVPVKVACASGEIATTYALLDAGSQASLILESFANVIGLEGENHLLQLGPWRRLKRGHPRKCVSWLAA